VTVELAKMNLEHVKAEAAADRTWMFNIDGQLRLAGAMTRLAQVRCVVEYAYLRIGNQLIKFLKRNIRIVLHIAIQNWAIAPTSAALH
jgi:hypothetical protein